MALIGEVFGTLFGQRNVVREVAEVFRENAENAGAREAAYQQAALGQFGAEFSLPRQGLFDRFIDALNRLPRPALALGTIGLFVSAMVNPVWFASRMQGVALVPEPLWWLMGAIVTFYFGARSQAKSDEFQRSITETLARTAAVTGNIRALTALDAGAENDAVATPAMATPAGENPALDEWRAGHAA